MHINELSSPFRMAVFIRIIRFKTYLSSVISSEISDVHCSRGKEDWIVTRWLATERVLDDDIVPRNHEMLGIDRWKKSNVQTNKLSELVNEETT